MNENNAVLNMDDIQCKIYTLRSVQIMFDDDLAMLYCVETKILNQAVKRNIDRFPKEFMFQLTENEINILRSQIVTSSWGGRRSNPYAFTEQGVAMLSAILRSETAIKMSIKIIKAFVTMRHLIATNAQIFQQLDILEIKQLETTQKIDHVLTAMENKEIHPKQGIFFDGQIFDAYKFIADLIRSAKESIVLIDNFIDDSVLTLFSKRKDNVGVTIYTKNISKQLTLDVKKYNEQYPIIKIIEFEKSHDRFLIIDHREVYHIGASLKDLGKKWFAFSKFDKDVLKLLEKLD
ncbi:ORF6N domain-containing protein [archaeon]|nr:ORF6N domain-containing protein [archaeon]